MHACIHSAMLAMRSGYQEVAHGWGTGRSGRWPSVACACFLDLPEVEQPAPLHTPGPNMLVLKRAQGGPFPFGLGQGITQLEEARSWKPLPPRTGEAEADRQRRARHELRRLARMFNKPIGHLSAQDQLAVQEERLRLILGKFWGLMHELDRPWHRPLIIKLCCQLPSPCRSLYRRLKPASLQRVISTRAQIEKQLHALHHQALSIKRQAAWLLRQERLRGVPRTQELRDLLAQVVDMKADAGRVQSELARSSHTALHVFVDQDYVQYCTNELMPVGHQVASWCDMFTRNMRRSMLEGSDHSSGHGKGRHAPNSGVSSDWLTAVPCPAYASVGWRYPPSKYLHKQAPLGKAAQATAPSTLEPTVLSEPPASVNMDDAAWFVDLEEDDESDDAWMDA